MRKCAHTSNCTWKLSNTSPAMNFIYSLPCFFSDSDDILNKFSCLVCTRFRYLYINSKDSKFHLNSH